MLRTTHLPPGTLIVEPVSTYAIEAFIKAQGTPAGVRLELDPSSTPLFWRFAVLPTATDYSRLRDAWAHLPFVKILP